MSTVKTFCLYFLLYYGGDLTNSCSNDGYPFEEYLSTKTPYRMVSNNSFSQMNYPGKHNHSVFLKN